MDGGAAHSTTFPDRPAGMDSNTHLRSEALLLPMDRQATLDLLSTADRVRSRRECNEEAVAHVVDLATPMFGERAPHHAL